MICAILDYEENDLVLLKSYVEGSEYVKKVVTFNKAYDLFLYLTRNNVDVLFVNLETPFVYDECLSGNTFENCSFIVLRSNNENLINNCLVRGQRHRVLELYKIDFLQIEDVLFKISGLLRKAQFN